MQNAGPESPRLRLRPALAGLALTMLAAAPAAAADETQTALGPEPRRHAAPAGREAAWFHWPVRPAVFAFGHAPDAAGEAALPALGLAFRLGDGVSLGAAGGVGPAGNGMIAVVALEIAF